MADIERLADWRGKDLVDRDGDKIGKLEDVFYDTETDEDEFGSVKEGLVGRHLTFVPLRGATTSPDHVQVSVTKDQVKDAPNLDSDAELEPDAEPALFEHYGLPYSPPETASGRRLARR